MKKYKRLSYEDRAKIEFLLKQVDTVAKIAKLIGYHRSIVKPELELIPRSYTTSKAYFQSLAKVKDRNGARKLEVDKKPLYVCV